MTSRLPWKNLLLHPADKSDTWGTDLLRRSNEEVVQMKPSSLVRPCEGDSRFYITLFNSVIPATLFPDSPRLKRLEIAAQRRSYMQERCSYVSWHWPQHNGYLCISSASSGRMSERMDGHSKSPVSDRHDHFRTLLRLVFSSCRRLGPFRPGICKQGDFKAF